MALMNLFAGQEERRRHREWTAILWPPDVKNGLIEKDPDSGKD